METGTYQIILEKVPEEKKAEAAIYLSGCFSIHPSNTKGIAEAAPIALVGGMARKQAEAVFELMSESPPASVVLRLAPEGEDEQVSRLQWPQPPRVYGRELSEFAKQPQIHEVDCPKCGARIRVGDDGGGGLTVLADARPEGTEETPASPNGVNEDDPVFSGVKPLSQSGNLASLQYLQAGDTGFWQSTFEAPGGGADPAPAESAPGGGETTGAKRTSGRGTNGLAAFMKSGAFAVVLGRARDNQVVKMLAEIMGISEDEARVRSMRLGTCVARDISLDEAQTLVARFKSLGARARIVKPG